MNLRGDKQSKDVFMTVAKLVGIVSVALDSKRWELTVIGNVGVDPVALVARVRKIADMVDILFIGPLQME